VAEVRAGQQKRPARRHAMPVQHLHPNALRENEPPRHDGGRMYQATH
jgi:hypothetical protein